jgi:hypothetical protein
MGKKDSLVLLNSSFEARLLLASFFASDSTLPGNSMGSKNSSNNITTTAIPSHFSVLRAICLADIFINQYFTTQ